MVQHVVLADADPLVAAFWYEAAFNTSTLVNCMMEEEVTVQRWDWWRAFDRPRRRLDRALKCLFLNRTTFSGILHGRAGPIGGRKQESPYPIDCRFNKEALAERIRAIGELANTRRILDVWDCDWRDSIARVKREYGDMLTPDEILVYLDPPYVEKAPFLYEWSFESEEHHDLAKALPGDTPFRWLLSYDDAALIRQLYPPQPGRTRLHVPHRYSAAGSKSRTVRDELLVTNFPDIPPSERYQVVSD